MMVELKQSLQLYVPSKDDFMSVLFVTDYRMDEHLYWTGIMQKTGEIWTLPNTDVRGIPNPSIGRVYKCTPEMDVEKDTLRSGASDKVPSRVCVCGDQRCRKFCL